MADRGSPHFGETTGIARAAGAVFFGCAGLVFALVVVGVAALQIAPLRRAALDAALDAVNRGEIKIGVDSIEGRWPDTLALHGLTVSDAKGRWLAVDAASIEWRPTALLLGEVHIARLSVRGLDIARAPESAAPSAGSGPGLPVLPFIVAVDDAKIETLTLGKALADPSAQGRIATIDAKAGFRLTPSHIDLTLAAARSRPRSRISFSTSAIAVSISVSKAKTAPPAARDLSRPSPNSRTSITSPSQPAPGTIMAGSRPMSGSPTAPRSRLMRARRGAGTHRSISTQA